MEYDAVASFGLSSLSPDGDGNGLALLINGQSRTESIHGTTAVILRLS